MTDQYFRPRNWDKHQGWRKRGATWIKNHTALLDDQDYRKLTPNARSVLHGLWMLCGRHGRVLPLSSRYLGEQMAIRSQTVGHALAILESNNFIELCDKSVALYSQESPVTKNKDIDERRGDKIEAESAPKVAPPSEPDNVDQAVQAWNALASECNLSLVQKVTAARRVSTRARLKDCGGIEGWLAALDKIRGSPGLLGENDRGWKIGFDFLIKESNFTKIMEGAYDHWKASSNGNGDAGRTQESDRRAIIAGMGRSGAWGRQRGDPPPGCSDGGQDH